MKGLVKLLFVLLTLLTAGSMVSAGNIVIKGSTTVLPIAQKAAEDFMKKNPEINVSVSGGGSGEGIKAILDGTTDIASSSREIKDSETALAKEKSLDVVFSKIAMDCVVPVVHPENPLKNITTAQLKDIYTGKITNWKDVGGADKPVVVISRDTSSGTYEVWNEKVLNKEKVTPAAQLAASSGAIAQAVSKNKYAIGYIGIGYLNKDLKAVSMEGIEASAETALSGKFPVSRALYMVTKGQPAGDSKLFIDYVLSAEGQKIVKEEGFVPLAK
jgi:phosphate transport system substrate-binding protein